MSARLTFRLGLQSFLIVAISAGIAAAGVRVKLEQVPKPAIKAVQDRFAKASIRYVDREIKNVYEFAMQEGDRLFDVGVNAEGKLLNIKDEIAEDKLPKAVKEGLLKKYPAAKIVETERVIVIDGKNEKVTYELKIKADKMTLEVVLDEAGKVLGE
jgi:hypothetical protein